MCVILNMCDIPPPRMHAMSAPPPPCSEFIVSTYPELKKANPTFPILVREASGIEAKLIARYGELRGSPEFSGRVMIGHTSARVMAPNSVHPRSIRQGEEREG